jgi:hypothetical protein
MGGIPLSKSAGTAINPPPPTSVSRKPAITPTKNKNTRISVVKFEISIDIIICRE